MKTDLIGKEVFVETHEGQFGYTSTSSWVKGTVVALFSDGDLLVEWGSSDKRLRVNQESVGFIDAVDLIDDTEDRANTKPLASKPKRDTKGKT